MLSALQKGCLFIFFILLVFACETKKQKDLSQLLGKIMLEPVDSIRLSNDSISFDFFSISDNSIQAYSYPAFDLTEIRPGEVFVPISGKGGSPSEFTKYIESVRDKRGYLYVLQSDFPVKIIIFDSTNQFVKNLDLRNIFKDEYAPPFNSYFQIASESSDEITFLFSLMSMNYSDTDEEYYETESIAEITLAKENFEIKRWDFHNNYNQYDIIKKQIEKDEKTWGNPTPYFSVIEEGVAVFHNFDNHLYLYDKGWNLSRKILLNFEFGSKEFSTPFEFLSNPAADYKAQIKWINCNRSVKGLNANEKFVFLTYNKPIAEGLVDELSIRKLPHKTVLHIVDLKTENQYGLVLPKNVFGGTIELIDEDKVMLICRNEDLAIEQIYLCTFKFNLRHKDE